MPVIAEKKAVVGPLVIDIMQGGEVRRVGKLQEKIPKSRAGEAASVIPVTTAITRLKDRDLGRAALKAHAHYVLGASHAEDVAESKHVGGFHRGHATLCSELLHVGKSEYGQAAGKAGYKRYTRNAILLVGVDGAEEGQLCNLQTRITDAQLIGDSRAEDSRDADGHTS